MFKFLMLMLLLSRHFAVFASTLPLQVNLTTEPISPLSDTDAVPHCPPEGSTQRPLPLLPDCDRAVRGLPRSHYIGTFHIGRDESLWRLPQSSSFASCKVLVTLSADFDLEMGSWVDVRAAAIELLVSCRLPFEEGGEQRTGGWITVGAENGILVELVISSAGVRNGTGAGTEQGTNVVDID